MRTTIQSMLGSCSLSNYVDQAHRLHCFTHAPIVHRGPRHQRREAKTYDCLGLGLAYACRAHVLGRACTVLGCLAMGCTSLQATHLQVLFKFVFLPIFYIKRETWAWAFHLGLILGFFRPKFEAISLIASYSRC